MIAPLPRPRVRPWQEDEGLATAVERAWREDIAPALKSVGRPEGNSRATGVTQKSETADSILARLKRDDPMTAQAVKGEPHPAGGRYLFSRSTEKTGG